MTQENETPVNEQKDTEQEEFTLDPEENTRMLIYKSIDKQRGVYQAPQEEEEPSEETEETEDATEETETEDVKETSEGSEEEPEETTEEPRIMSRAEFAKEFGKLRIKDKFAGEEVEVPVEEVVKGYGLEKHWTRKLQELSRRERELKQATPPAEGPSEEEIEIKFNELYEESPFKAQKYLDEIKAKEASGAESTTQAYIERAVKDFRETFPECSDDDWKEMNDERFWTKYPEIVSMRDKEDPFVTFATAYRRLVDERFQIGEPEVKKAPKPEDKTERKKKGQVTRTQIKPTVKKDKRPVTVSKEQQNRDYIAAISKRNRERMGLPE